MPEWHVNQALIGVHAPIRTRTSSRFTLHLSSITVRYLAHNERGPSTWTKRPPNGTFHLLGIWGLEGGIVTVFRTREKLSLAATVNSSPEKPAP
eukprot:162553-Rhodomonas_salina.3